MMNHEGQPRPSTQPTNACDTAGQKYTHPKVREGQQGDFTCKPSRHHRNWSTLTQGAKPQLPQQASRAGEAQKKKGRAEAPSHATREAEGQTPGDRKNPKGASSWEGCASRRPRGRAETWEKTKWRSKDPTNPTPGVDQETGQTCWRTRQGCKTPKGKKRKGELLRHKVETKWGIRTSVPRQPQPRAKHLLQD